MASESYINKIIDETGLSRKEIQHMVEDKKTELKGLISDEGALILIAKELNVDVKGENKNLMENLEIKVSDVTPSMKNLVLVGRIKDVNKIFSFDRDDGSKGYVGSFTLNDGTGEIRIVLWDDHVKILTDNNFSQNELVKIINGYAKQGRYAELEVHLSRFGKIVLAPEDININSYPKIKDEIISISDLNKGMRSVSIEGQIIRSIPISEFTKKDGTTGKRASINVMDSSGTIRITFWDDNTDKIKNVKEGDYLLFRDLKVRENSLIPGTVELSSTNNTQVKKLEKPKKIMGSEIKKIDQIDGHNKLLSFEGIITSIEELKMVNTRGGEEISLLSFDVSDDTATIRVTAWRDKAIDLNKKITEGMGVKLKNVNVRQNQKFNRKEVNYTSVSELEKIDLKFANLKKKEQANMMAFNQEYTPLKNINSNGYYQVKGVIVKKVSTNDMIIYNACPNCYKKIENCSCETKSESEKRVIIKVILDDETDSIRTVFFGEMAEKLLGISNQDLDSIEDFTEILNELGGKELIVKGKGELNDFNNANRYELKVSSFKEVNVNDELSILMEDF